MNVADLQTVEVYGWKRLCVPRPCFVCAARHWQRVCVVLCSECLHRMKLQSQTNQNFLEGEHLYKTEHSDKNHTASISFFSLNRFL